MTNNNRYQERFWKEFVQLKTSIYYLEEYLKCMELRSNCINGFLAIASCGGIGGWAIWNEYGKIWGAIIAISQVINAIRPFFPYKKRIKALPALIDELSQVAIFAEKNLYDIAEGKLEMEQIHKKRLEIVSRRSKATRKHVGKSPLPVKEDLQKVAEEKAVNYFGNFYGEGA